MEQFDQHRTARHQYTRRDLLNDIREFKKIRLIYVSYTCNVGCHIRYYKVDPLIIEKPNDFVQRIGFSAISFDEM